MMLLRRGWSGNQGNLPFWSRPALLCWRRHSRPDGKKDSYYDKSLTIGVNILYFWITKGFTFNMNASHDWTIFKRRQLYLWIMFRLEHDAKLASGHMDALTDLLVDLHLRKHRIINIIFYEMKISRSQSAKSIFLLEYWHQGTRRRRKRWQNPSRREVSLALRSRPCWVSCGAPSYLCCDDDANFHSEGDNDFDFG